MDVVRSIADEYGWFSDPSIVRRKVALASNLIGGFTGKYRLGPAATMRIFVDGDRLYSQVTDQERLEIFPTSDRVFSAIAANVVLVFDTDGSTSATQIVVHQGGRDVTASRVS